MPRLWCGSRRKRFKAIWRRTAKVWAPLSLRIRQASSSKETSRTQWREFSMPQCCRTAWANRTGLNLRISPNEIFQLLALTVMLAPTFDDAQEFGMFCQKQDQIGGLATLYGTTVVVEGTKHHLDRDALQGFAQNLCHLLAERQQHRIENERGVNLQLDGIGGARPQVRQIHHPFGQRERILDPPASPVQLTDLAGRQLLRSEDVGQRAVPRPLPQDRHHAQWLRTGVRAVQANLDHLIAIGRALA